MESSFRGDILKFLIIVPFNTSYISPFPPLVPPSSNHVEI